ncbi:MAG: hypothetical protein IKK14_01565 [Oscillospiraceae bacterium]|nr:hypothetical protein [Oscillospiraceae bacterium]
MKRIIMLTAFVLLLSGCSNSPAATPQEVAKAYEKDFSASAMIVFGDNKAEFDVLKNGMSISISLNSPAELSGMGIEIFDEHAKITYNGMEQEIRKNSLPEGTPFLLLEELFEELSDPEDFSLSTENENLTADFGDFSAVLSAEDFSLIGAEFPFYETKFTFSNFEFKSAE